MAKAERSCVSITRLVPDGWTAGGSSGGGRARKRRAIFFLLCVYWTLSEVIPRSLGRWIKPDGMERGERERRDGAVERAEGHRRL